MKINEIISEGKTGPGLWANIHAKRKRGERMRKPGSKGAPTDQDFKDAASEGVAESTSGKLPRFLSYVLANSQGQFSDIEEIEDLFDYAYLSDLNLETIADGADEEGVSALKWMTPRMAWLLNNINDKSKLAVIKPLAASWMKTVAPAIDKYVKDVLNDLDEGVAEGILEETYNNDDEFFEAYGVMEYNDEMINEAEYQGRKVTLNKPMQGDVKKFKVYTKNEKGNVVKVNFGDPNSTIKKNNPARRKSFRARHNCDNPGPKTGARYWSCRKW
jgi:hypothetical protein